MKNVKEDTWLLIVFFFFFNLSYFQFNKIKI